MEHLYYIYKHTNINNKKVYIGITRLEPKQRWKNNGNGYLYHKTTKFSRAIKKYGWDSFEHEIIEKVYSLKKANEREKYWIKYFDSFNNGYNSTVGGDGTNGHIVDKNTIIKLKKSHKGQHSSPKTEFKKGHTPWNKGLKGKTTAWNKGMYGEKNCRSKRVYQYDLKTKKLIASYGSTREASRIVRIPAPNIQSVCKGKRNKAAGYFWSYDLISTEK